MTLRRSCANTPLKLFVADTVEVSGSQMTTSPTARPLVDYKSQKAAVDIELDRLRAVHSALEAYTARMQMDEQTKSARAKLAQEATEAGGLTVGLAETLIDRVYVYPGNRVEIVWKMKDLYMSDM